MTAKLLFDVVQKAFQDSGCQLLETYYENARTPMNFRCSCGKEAKIRYDDFRRGRRCHRCGIAKMIQSKKHKFEHVKKVFEDNGCTLISTNYVNNRTKLVYICSCGKRSVTRFDCFDGRCGECRGK